MGHAEPMVLLLCVLALLAGDLLLRDRCRDHGPSRRRPCERQRTGGLPAAEAVANGQCSGRLALAASVHQTSPGTVQDQLVDEPAPVPPPAGWATYSLTTQTVSPACTVALA